MTDDRDIVERLTAPHGYFGRLMRCQAATEIKALRAKVAGYQKDADEYLVRLDELNALRAENARLQERLADEEYVSKDLEEMFQNMRTEADALRAENARLREALKPFAEAADIYNLNDFLPSIDEEYTSFQIGLCRAARAAMGESDELVG